MSLLWEYEQALHGAELARLRRTLAVRGMLVQGGSQREIAQRLGVTQPAVSYQTARERTETARPRDLVAAGAAVLREIAEQRGFTDLAVFGSVARGEDRADSDIDLLVRPPLNATAFDLIHLQEAFELILGLKVDVVSYRGLDPALDRDILRDRVLL